MGYFRGEDIEEIEMEMENPKSKSTFKFFYWLSEQDHFAPEKCEETVYSDEKFRLTLFEPGKSA